MSNITYSPDELRLMQYAERLFTPLIREGVNGHVFRRWAGLNRNEINVGASDPGCQVGRPRPAQPSQKVGIGGSQVQPACAQFQHNHPGPHAEQFSANLREQVRRQQRDNSIRPSGLVHLIKLFLPQSEMARFG
jgi:hypothetical protein